MTNTTPTLYPDLKGSDRVSFGCGKCGGTGLYTAPTYYKDNTGRPYCFDCNGTGTYSVLVSSLRAADRRERKAAEERKAAAEAFAAKAAAFWAEHQAIRDEATAAHIELRDGDPLRAALGSLLDAVEGSLDEEAAKALPAILATIAAAKAAKVAAPEGRVDVEGVIVGLKYREPFAYGAAGSWAIVVECDGYKLYGTLPSSISQAERGDRVAFTATVERSADDEAFGFYKRPTKARLLGTPAI